MAITDPKTSNDTKASKPSKVAQTIENNKQLLTTAALFEAGRIANNKLSELLGEKLPAPFNLLIATPLGQLVVANLLQLAGDQFRPEDDLVHRLTNGMTVAAYTSLIQSFDVEGILNDLLSDKTIAAALTRSGKA